MIDLELIDEIRRLAANGTSVCDMAITIITKLGVSQDARVPVIAHLRTAFGLGLADLMPIGAWSFFPGGTWSREEVEHQVMPLIMQTRENWHQPEQ